MSKVYDIVTEKIIQNLERGTVPWRQPWRTKGGIPANLISGKKYRGVNLMLLSLSSLVKGYESQYWLTFKQSTDLGAKVRQGEKATLVVFYKQLTGTKEVEMDNLATGERETTRIDNQMFVLRYYNVFNTEQCDGLCHKRLEKDAVDSEEINPIETAEKIVMQMPNPPAILYGYGKACYIPRLDQIHLPNKDNFITSEGYYSTLFHELTHSTGHETRLSREGVMNQAMFGDERYSKEELVAEFGAAFLCAEAGISQNQTECNSAYISSWLERLNSDKRMLVQAASQAQKAADYILNRTDEEE